ncbi:hypothetical protein NUW58_g6460 [Xylaria curta]|uniref:Uncharacterized protein n=1 Tax=Xylaria curta TaxID=42375 RepID=A0ACC1NV46_9PEZI|nr:hypothetical protein NUW58_g6460 [Xylaria curta]
MTTTAPCELDPLGGMFTPDEKRILRDRDPGQKQARDGLVLRLADAFSFRRVPRCQVHSPYIDDDFGWRPPVDCFKRAQLPEIVGPLACHLPAMTDFMLDKAIQVIESVSLGGFRAPFSPSSGVTTAELTNILETSESGWVNGGKDQHLRSIIDHIPNYKQINKVVCIGLSEIAGRYEGASADITVNSRCLVQHLAVMSIVRYLRGIVSHEIKLFAADWIYDIPHKEALWTLGFATLDTSYRQQEHFAEIDDNTMLISFGIAGFESILPIISEYAHPVAMIYDAYDYLIKEEHARPPLSPLFSHVEYGPDLVTIPGPPLIAAEESDAEGLSGWRPLYTKSTGEMLDDYNIAMNLFEFDVTGLANRFHLHPNTDHIPGDASEIEKKRFVGENSRLFVRKW